MSYIVDAMLGASGENGVRHIGKFETLEPAVDAARRVVDEILKERFRDGMSPRELYAAYEAASVSPYVFQDHDENTFNVRSFNHQEYAKQRCAQICAAPRARG